MALNVPLLRQSFELVTEREPQLVRRFYQILFERYPLGEAAVPPRLGGQAGRDATATLVAVMDRLEDAAWLVGDPDAARRQAPRLRRHRGDVRLGRREPARDAWPRWPSDDWSPEHAAAWTEAYGTIASLMLAGMKAEA